MFVCKLYKVMLEYRDALGLKEAKFYAYHMTENKARKAALTWCENEFADSEATIKSIDTLS